MGRPTKYKKKFCTEIVQFFDKPLTYEVTSEKYVNGKKKKVSETRTTDLPTFERFAFERGVTVSTMFDWRQTHQEFSDAYAVAQSLQEQMIVANTLAGRWGGSFPQFYLKNKHGYQDKSEVDNKLSGNQTVTVVTRNYKAEDVDND